MPESHAQALRAMFRKWERGRFAAGSELFAPDIRFSGTLPEGQVHATGLAEIERFMRQFLAGWEHYRVELHELEELPGERFIARATQHGKGTGSGVETTAPAFIAIAFGDSQIVQLEFFLERERALKALGQAA